MKQPVIGKTLCKSAILKGCSCALLLIFIKLSLVVDWSCLNSKRRLCWNFSDPRNECALRFLTPPVRVITSVTCGRNCLLQGEIHCTTMEGYENDKGSHFLVEAFTRMLRNSFRFWTDVPGTVLVYRTEHFQESVGIALRLFLQLFVTGMTMNLTLSIGKSKLFVLYSKFKNLVDFCYLLLLVSVHQN